MDQSVASGIGHNSEGITVRITLRLFNSLTRFREDDEAVSELELPAGTTVGDLARRLCIPLEALYLVLINGRDVSPGLVGAGVREHHLLEDGDRVAFSGAVPYSFGYGAPVV